MKLSKWNISVRKRVQFVTKNKPGVHKSIKSFVSLTVALYLKMNLLWKETLTSDGQQFHQY